MRVIAGSARRLLLKTPLGDNTRPTTDRIKETLFNMIQNEVPGSVFLDLFAYEAASFLGLNAYRFVPGKNYQALMPIPGRSALRSVPIPYLLLPVSFLIAFH